MNMEAILFITKIKDIIIKIVNIKKNGKVCFEDLKKKINKNTKVVSLCHVASQCGNRIDAEKIFNYVKQFFS